MFRIGFAMSREGDRCHLECRLFRIDAVRPLNEGNKNCRITIFRAPLVEISLPNATCSAASPACVNLYFLIRQFFHRFKQWRPANRHHCRCF